MCHVIYVRAKFYRRNWNGSLLIVIKLEAEKHIVNVLQIFVITMKVAYFSKTCYSDLWASVAGISTLSQVRSSVMLLI
jgi:hypothetical protein